MEGKMEEGRKNSPGMMWAFDISKSNFSDTSPSTWPHVLFLLKTFNYLADKKLKYMDLWVPFSFKLHSIPWSS